MEDNSSVLLQCKLYYVNNQMSSFCITANEWLHMLTKKGIDIHGDHLAANHHGYRLSLAANSNG